MAGAGEIILYLAHKAHLVAVERHGGRYGKPLYIIITCVIVVGGLEYVDAFEEVDSEIEDYKGDDDQQAYHYFFTKDLFHYRYMLVSIILDACRVFGPVFFYGFGDSFGAFLASAVRAEELLGLVIADKVELDEH